MNYLTRKLGEMDTFTKIVSVALFLILIFGILNNVGVTKIR